MRYSLAIVGSKFRPPSAGLLSVLPSAFPLRVQREPSNAYDANAVMVVLDDVAAFSALDSELVNEKLAGYGFTKHDALERMREAGPFHLGYIPREQAAQLASVLDSVGGSCAAQLGFSITGQMRVQFSVEESE
jgi:hypothetical protein